MMNYRKKREMSVAELEAALREIVFRYDWGAFFRKVQPIWIDFRKPEKPLVFLMPQIPCPCGGTFFINVHFVAMPNHDHQKDCPFKESSDCTRRHFFQVLIEAQRDGQSKHLLYFANFRIPVERGWWTEIHIPIAIVVDHD